MIDIDKLVQDLGHPGVPLEIGVLLGCLAVAFGICWLIGRRQPPESVWFGRAIVDGLLFPLLALVLHLQRDAGAGADAEGGAAQAGAADPDLAGRHPFPGAGVHGRLPALRRWPG